MVVPDDITTDITIVTTESITTTVSSVVTPTCANAQPTFALQVVGGAYNGEYLYSTPFVGKGSDLASANAQHNTASAYTLNGTVLSEYTGNILAVPVSSASAANIAFNYWEFQPASAVAAGTATPLSCSISSGTLSCSVDSATSTTICNISGPVTCVNAPGYAPSGFGCTSVALDVLPLCVPP